MSQSHSKSNTSQKAKTAARIKNNHGIFYFGKQNYYWLFGGLALIILGSLLMIGGESNNPNVYDAEGLYSFQRITLAPILIIIGFIVEVFAIMKKPKATQE